MKKVFKKSEARVFLRNFVVFIIGRQLLGEKYLKIYYKTATFCQQVPENVFFKIPRFSTRMSLCQERTCNCFLLLFKYTSFARKSLKSTWKVFEKY